MQDFNKKPKKGLEYLVSKDLIENTPEDVGNFLYTSVGLSKRKLGEFLGDMYVKKQKRRKKEESKKEKIYKKSRKRRNIYIQDRADAGEPLMLER